MTFSLATGCPAIIFHRGVQSTDSCPAATYVRMKLKAAQEVRHGLLRRSPGILLTCEPRPASIVSFFTTPSPSVSLSCLTSSVASTTILPFMVSSSSSLCPSTSRSTSLPLPSQTRKMSTVSALRISESSLRRAATRSSPHALPRVLWFCFRRQASALPARLLS